jgi:hypothetical protein
MGYDVLSKLRSTQRHQGTKQKELKKPSSLRALVVNFPPVREWTVRRRQHALWKLNLPRASATIAVL